jgi:hypothetical protein
MENIKVALRIRPLNEKERADNERSIWEVKDN